MPFFVVTAAELTPHLQRAESIHSYHREQRACGAPAASKPAQRSSNFTSSEMAGIVSNESQTASRMPGQHNFFATEGEPFCFSFSLQPSKVNHYHLQPEKNSANHQGWFEAALEG